MSLFTTLLKLKGFPIEKAQLKLNEINDLSRQEFLAYQEKKKWEIYNEHFNNNPFYRNKCEGIAIKEWKDIPLMKKKDLQAPLEQILNPKFKVNEVYTSKTSGSTGVPMIFAKDKYCHAFTWASILQKYSRHGIHADDKQARFYGIPIEGLPYYKEKFKDLVSNRVRFVVNDLSDHVLENFIEKFKKTKFKYLYGYTNSLKLFAQILVKNKVILKNICPTITYCIITSEVCTPQDEELMKKAFGIPILNEYGASELGVIAFPDQEFNWKISDEELFVEVLDEHGLPVEGEKEGRIIITSLNNEAMPFIRYELGDIVSIKKDPKLGNFLNSLHGRLNDTVRLPSGKIVPGLTLYYASKVLMSNMEGLKEYNIKQTALDTIEYDLVAEGMVDDRLFEMIEKVTFTYLEPGLKVKINKVEQIKRTNSGKFKHFQSFIDSPEILSR